MASLPTTTRMVSIRSFRENMTKFLRESQENNVHFIVMRHAEPVARVSPLNKKRLTMREFEQEIAEAREQVKRGEVFTQKEMEEMLGM
jgi:antitoxin (DNA-binding transcriptional repressor) of toxin-antitoxin stability system